MTPLPVPGRRSLVPNPSALHPPRRPRPPHRRATSAGAVAADRIVPIGLALSGRRCPARSRGSARTARSVPCAVWRSPSEADGSIPSEPARTAASSERMSPNRFSVTSTSNRRPLDQEHRRVDQAVVRRHVRELPVGLLDDLAPQARRGEHVRLVHARSAGRRRARASSKPSRTDASGSRPRCRATCRFGRRSCRLARRLGPLAEVDPAGQLADDQQVDAGQRAPGGAARPRPAPGGRSPGRRLANSPRPPRRAKRACSGRTAAFGSSHFGPPTAPSRTASAPRRPRRPRPGSRRRTRRSPRRRRRARVQRSRRTRTAARPRRGRHAQRRAPPARRRRRGSRRGGTSPAVRRPRPAEPAARTTCRHADPRSGVTNAAVDAVDLRRRGAC